MEPRAVTATPVEERDPVFAPEGDAILFVSDKDGERDVWRAERGDAALFWWQNTQFRLERLTQDARGIESSLQWSPEGSRVAFIKGGGDLWVMDPRGKEARRVVGSWDPPEYDWSPDGAWLVYSRADEDFNQDIWLIPVDGSRLPFNLSRHPDNESSPVWSPDGKAIAFTGRRVEDEVDIYYIWLRAEDDETTQRDRTLEKAVDKIKQARQKAARRPREEPKEKDDDPNKTTPPDTGRPDTPSRTKTPPKVAIDFDGIHERLHHVAIPDATETGLFWSPDSKKLAFSASIEGKPGVYTIELLDDPKPKPLTTQAIRQARWIEPGNQLVGLVDGVPASLAASASRFRFRFGLGLGLGQGISLSFSGPADGCSSPTGSAPPSTSAGGPCATATTTNVSAIATGTRSGASTATWPRRLPTWRPSPPRVMET